MVNRIQTTTHISMYVVNSKIHSKFWKGIQLYCCGKLILFIIIIIIIHNSILPHTRIHVEIKLRILFLHFYVYYMYFFTLSKIFRQTIHLYTYYGKEQCLDFLEKIKVMHKTRLNKLFRCELRSSVNSDWPEELTNEKWKLHPQKQQSFAFII